MLYVNALGMLSKIIFNTGKRLFRVHRFHENPYVKRARYNRDLFWWAAVKSFVNNSGNIFVVTTIRVSEKPIFEIERIAATTKSL